MVTGVCFLFLWLPAPVCEEADLLSVGLLVVIGDQAHNRGVICKFDDDIGAVSG